MLRAGAGSLRCRLPWSGSHFQDSAHRGPAVSTRYGNGVSAGALPATAGLEPDPGRLEAVADHQPRGPCRLEGCELLAYGTGGLCIPHTAAAEDEQARLQLVMDTLGAVPTGPAIPWEELPPEDPAWDVAEREGWAHRPRDQQR